MNRIIALTVLIAGLFFYVTPVFADQSLTVGEFHLGIADENDFLSGRKTFNDVPVYWESDVPWQISMSSLDPNLGISDNGQYAKPLSDFLWKPSDKLQWVPLTQYPQEIGWGGETGNGVFYIDIEIVLDLAKDLPGDYRGDILFSISPL
jgi:hypothetical protein